jgi:hypothetical protein
MLDDGPAIVESIPMNPAQIIISRLGGEAQVAFVTATSYTAPYRWQAAKAKGGTGGLIPQRYHRTLLDYARSRGIALTAEDFLPAVETTSPSIIPPRPRRVRAEDGPMTGPGPSPESSDAAEQSRRPRTTAVRD